MHRLIEWLAGFLLVLTSACDRTPGHEAAGRPAAGAGVAESAAAAGDADPAPPTLDSPTLEPVSVSLCFDRRYAELGEELAGRIVSGGHTARAVAAAGHSEQLGQIEAALAAGTEVLVVLPLNPLLRQYASKLARDEGVPVVLLLRGFDAESAVGFAADAGVPALAARVTSALRSKEISRPRVLVVEDRSWPRSVARANALLSEIEGQFPGTELVARFSLEHDVEYTALAVQASLDYQRNKIQLGRIDLVIAGCESTTEAALAGVAASRRAADAVVTGVRFAAAEGGARHVLHCDPDDLRAAVLSAVTALIDDPATPVRRELALKLPVEENDESGE